MDDKESQWSDLNFVESLIGTYEISSDGKIRNKKMKRTIGSVHLRNGYKSVGLKDGKSYKIHRLVAMAFIEKPKDYDTKKYVVNHKDGNKLNNHVDNLEWVTYSRNNEHAREEGLNITTKRAIIQIDPKTDKEIKRHDTIRGAAKETDIDAGGIAKVCKGQRNTAGGYIWKFAQVNENEKELSTEELKEFKPIDGFPNALINRKGQVYSVRYKKFMKQQQNKEGHLTISLANQGKKKFFLMHRLLAASYLGIDPDDSKILVTHRDKDPSNNSLNNLKLVKDGIEIKPSIKKATIKEKCTDNKAIKVKTKKTILANQIPDSQVMRETV